MRLMRIAPLTAAALLFATPVLSQDEQVSGTDPEAVREVMLASFTPRNNVELDTLDQNFMQRECSAAEMKGEYLSAEVDERIRAEAEESVVYPEDGDYLGDWREGEKIAQSGRGFQYSDDPDAPRGGNCYACHQLSVQEIAYGTIGPSLHQYGQIMGDSEEMLAHTWSQIYSPHIQNACSVMPRFGYAGILTGQQMKDVMALLFDSGSPVNDDTVDP